MAFDGPDLSNTLRVVGQEASEPGPVALARLPGRVLNRVRTVAKTSSNRCSPSLPRCVRGRGRAGNRDP